MEQRMEQRGGDTTESVYTAEDINREHEFEPFNIENDIRKETSFSSSFSGDSSSSDNLQGLPKASKDVISAADVLKTLFFVLVWYTFSTFLTLYNKTLLGDDLGKFPAPFLMNTIHFSMQAVLSNMITWYWSERFQPGVTISWRDYFIRVVPTAFGTAMDVNLSNASLVFISVTFATMCKSAAPIFLLLFAFAFRLESPSLKLFGIMLIISAGVLLTVLLQKEAYGLKNPFTFMSYVTPVMALVTGLLSLLFDPWSEFRSNQYFDSRSHIARSGFLMLFGGALAFFMVLTEYVLVSVTSAVTVTIAGVVKEAVTIVVAVFYFHDEFTWLKGVGLIIIMFGVCLFNWYKYDKLQKGHKSEDEKNLSASSQTGKYVILDEMDDQENSV
ncbi:PREDICTED: probable sugar phosphate/phosphate translocator At1g06470 isoform X2 [Tarenaya hassleriana]|uniref:probable sugar phosphate/phosphate translocator At1g06470 isoform X2 n=1 Tax=Tarenaya hassleriana TaxID=28532 RepID=UPI00053C1899|nr:PREDICTED: probable sugar phosphate/phosphate translocator At1g06470 isoform X2 [Tarenaya hassleriana]